jgi:hypothetical protein
VISTIAIVLALGTGGAYAADTIGSSDVIDESLLSQDVKNGQISAVDMKNNSVISRTVLDESLTGADIGNSSVKGEDVGVNTLSGTNVAFDSLTGSDVSEATLNLRRMGCQDGKVLGFARVKGADVPATYTDSLSAVDRASNCAFENTGALGAHVTARRASTGVYYVRFEDNPSSLGIAISNSDDVFAPGSSRVDNVISVSSVPCDTCGDLGAFRVEVEDVTASGNGTTETDGWFTIMVM